MILRRIGSVWRLVRANWTRGVSVYVVALAISITATVYAQPADNGVNESPDRNSAVSGASEDDCDPKIPYDCTPTATPTKPIPTPTAGECDLKEENCEPATSAPVPPATHTPTPKPDPTDTPTPVPDPTDTPTPEPDPTDTPTPVPDPTDTPTPVPDPTDTPTPVPDPTDTPTPEPDPTNTPTPVPDPPEPPTTTETLAFTTTFPYSIQSGSILEVTARARNLEANVEYSLSFSTNGLVGIGNCSTRGTGGTRITPPEGTKSAYIRACHGPGGGTIHASLHYYDTKYKEERLLLKISHDIRVVLPPDPCTNLSFQDAQVQDQTWTTATVVNVTLPEATGDSCDPSYTLEGPTSNPGLPSGVVLDSGTRQLSGTPTARMARTQYTWTATDRRDSSTTTSLTFHITVTEVPTPTPPPPPGLPKLKAPTGLDVTPLPERKARLSWTAVSNATGYTIQIRYAGVDWPTPPQQERIVSTRNQSININLDNVVHSKGLADEGYFEFQVKATGSANTNLDSEFSETVRIIDTPVVSINGDSRGRNDMEDGKALVKWTRAPGLPTYTIRHRMLSDTHSDLSWRPAAATSESDWSEEMPTYDQTRPTLVIDDEITGLEQGAVHAFQIIYSTDSGTVFSAREAYVWPSNRVSNRSEPGEIVGGMPVHPNPVTTKTDSGTIAYFYRICEDSLDSLPTGGVSDWVNFINHALLQWEYAAGGLIKMVHEVDDNGNSLPCADYTDFLDTIVSVVSTLEGIPTTAELEAVVRQLLAHFRNIGVKSTRTGEIIFTNPPDGTGGQRMEDLLLNEIFMVPEITSAPALRTRIFNEISEDIDISNCGTAACAVTSETTDAAGDEIRTADIYLNEASHGGRRLIDLSGGRTIEFNTCPDYPDGTPSPDYNYPYSSLVHEAGHALGIGHPQRGMPGFPDAIMNYPPPEEPDCSPHPFDILAIYALYQSVE